MLNLKKVTTKAVGASMNSTPEGSTEEGRKEEILAAVLKIASTEGFDKVTVRKVAALAGVSYGLVTYHYATKERLILEAWWTLLEHESRRRDETIVRTTALQRFEEV